MSKRPGLPAWLLSWVILAFTSHGVVAGEFLVRKQRPPDDELAKYDDAVQKTLPNGASMFPYVRMVVEPSFSPEWMIEVLEPVSGRAEVRLVTASSQVWPLSHPRSVITKKAGITPGTATLLRELWVALVIPARGPADSNDGPDGEFYYLSAYTPESLSVTAEVWSPPEHSNPGQLVSLGYALQRLVQAEAGNRAILEAEVVKKAQELQRAIASRH